MEYLRKTFKNTPFHQLVTVVCSVPLISILVYCFINIQKLNCINMPDLTDKVILVSKRIISDSGTETYDTYFGKVKTFNTNTVVVLRPSGEEESLPYGEGLYEQAEKGFYELDDGSTHEDPDWIVEFVVWETQEAYEKHKERNP